MATETVREVVARVARQIREQLRNPLDGQGKEVSCTLEIHLPPWHPYAVYQQGDMVSLPGPAPNHWTAMTDNVGLNPRKWEAVWKPMPSAS
jgi:hypothetical protein